MEDHWISENAWITKETVEEGVPVGLENGLPATLSFLTSPRMKEAADACLRTFGGITRGMMDHYRAVEVHINGEKVYLLFGTKLSISEILYRLQNCLKNALESVISVVYNGRQYDWGDHVCESLLVSVEKKVSPKLATLLFSQKQKNR